MPSNASSESVRLLPRLLSVVGVLVLAGAAGWIAGRYSVDSGPELAAPKAPLLSRLVERKPAPDPLIDPSQPPLFVHLGVGHEGDWTAASGEIRMAAAHGMHQYLMPLRLPWYLEDPLAEAKALIDRVVELNPKAVIVFIVDMNAPPEWLKEFPGTAMEGEDSPFACPASPEWRAQAGAHLERLLAGIEGSTLRDRVMGYVLSGLLEGKWRLPGGIDRSPASVAGFRAWLEGTYPDDESLRAAWNDGGGSRATATPPVDEAPCESAERFYPRPQFQRRADFVMYQSASVADALAGFASRARQVLTRSALLLAPYGYSFDYVSNDAGHLGLGLLLASDLDGFISPVSNQDRGLTGVGGPMGPFNSAQYHGKVWFIIDDTRTGMERDPQTETIIRRRGLRDEDVYNVQRRNFSLAAVHGLGLAWSDPQGEGWLHDPEQWEVLAQLRDVYASLYPPIPVEQEQGEELEPLRERRRPPFDPGLLVVVDEASRAYQRCDAEANSTLLARARDAALKSGASTQFCLLQDVLDGVAPPSPVYLFLNAFRLSANDRARLHQRLANEEACALWLYAPGFIESSASVENVAATVGMKVKPLPVPSKSSSTFALTGRWVDQGAVFGEMEEWNPLFFIEDDETDVIAHYQDSKKPSIAMRFLPEGWTSVFLAEPHLTAGVLREILRILEQPSCFRSTSTLFFDTAHVGNDLLAVHAVSNGERAMDAGRLCDIQDLFDPQIGWPQKESFMMPLKTGETRLLKLSPL